MSTYQENSLVQISDELLVNLRESYKVNWPEHIIAYNFIETMIKRYKSNPETREINKIYSINGEANGDATFIGIMVSESEKKNIA